MPVRLHATASMQASVPAAGHLLEGVDDVDLFIVERLGAALSRAICNR